MAPDSGTAVSADFPSDSTQMAWSRHEHRWVIMTFVEFQAWLARPDLDPAGFVTGEMGS